MGVCQGWRFVTKCKFVKLIADSELSQVRLVDFDNTPIGMVIWHLAS